MNISWLTAWTTISGFVLLSRPFTLTHWRQPYLLRRLPAPITAQYHKTKQTWMATAPCAALMGLTDEAEAIARSVLGEAGYTVVTLGTGPEAFDLLAGDDYAIAVWAMPDAGFHGSRLLRLTRLLDLSTAFIVIDHEDDPTWRPCQLDAGAQAVLMPPLQANPLGDVLTQIRSTPARWRGASPVISPNESAAIIDPRSIKGVPRRTVFRIARSMVEATDRLMAEALQGAWPRVAIMARMLRGMADCVGARSLITACNLLDTLCQTPDVQAQWPMLRQALETSLDRTLDALWLTQRQASDVFSGRYY
ncbi:hypothetical protein [Burkholderia gladioli]|uniref:hypothetical protein n=1 Tax=Burkholderia gladioli TaxID=28095 RepID=UPI001640A886|nr:hypothetical protein [Burkholderia gladioli]